MTDTVCEKSARRVQDIGQKLIGNAWEIYLKVLDSMSYTNVVSSGVSKLMVSN